MNTRHLVDPKLEPLLDLLPPLLLSASTLPTFRTFITNLLPAAKPPDDVTRQELLVPGPTHAPNVRTIVYRPVDVSGPLPAILDIHGGGMVMGSPELNDERNATLVKDLGCVIVSVDYRLAPETPAPGNIEDCYAALGWMHCQAAELGIDAARIAVMGQSAGGGLAAALALLARDRREYPIALQVLLYPMIDDRTGPASATAAHLGEFVWTATSNAFGWSALLGGQPGGDDVSPYVAPARATNLSGLPPTFIAVGALDLFLEEDMEYARRLAVAGVPTELHVYPGAVHGFDLIADAAVSKAFVRDHRDALSRFIHGTLDR